MHVHPALELDLSSGERMDIDGHRNVHRQLGSDPERGEGEDEVQQVGAAVADSGRDPREIFKLDEVHALHEPKIHLITSAGMSIQRFAVACIGCGIIFNVDRQHTYLNMNKGTYAQPDLLFAGPDKKSFEPLNEIELDFDNEPAFVAHTSTGRNVDKHFDSKGIIKGFRSFIIPQKPMAS